MRVSRIPRGLGLDARSHADPPGQAHVLRVKSVKARRGLKSQIRLSNGEIMFLFWVFPGQGTLGQWLRSAQSSAVCIWSLASCSTMASCWHLLISSPFTLVYTALRLKPLPLCPSHLCCAADWLCLCQLTSGSPPWNQKFDSLFFVRIQMLRILAFWRGIISSFHLSGNLPSSFPHKGICFFLSAHSRMGNSLILKVLSSDLNLQRHPLWRARACTKIHLGVWTGWTWTHVHGKSWGGLSQTPEDLKHWGREVKALYPGAGVIA